MDSIVIQTELIFSLIIMVSLCVVFIILGNKVKKADPRVRPSGVILVLETGVSGVYNYIKSIMPQAFEKNYYPYFSLMFIYLTVANLSGLLAFDAPTSNFSITLAITLITFLLIQYNAIKKQGGFRYLLNVVWPPTNILSVLSPLVSLSMRLFGNVLSGSILMMLVYSFTGWLSSFIIPVDFIGPLLGAVLHAYFDVFSGVIQTLIFVTLSSILIVMETE